MINIYIENFDDECSVDGKDGNFWVGGALRGI